MIGAMGVKFRGSTRPPFLFCISSLYSNQIRLNDLNPFKNRTFIA